MTEYILYNNPSKCYGCCACEQVCPRNAIAMKANDEGFLYPVLNEALCVKCGLCTKVCPHDNPGAVPDAPLKVFAAQYNQREVLEESSSGGIFSAVADYVLQESGAVSGSVFDDHFRAIHVVTDNPKIVDKMRGSKYVQSDTQNTYPEIKERLNKGQFVLFTGTPCQVDGLKNYLGSDDKNLVTIDLICHGVPSPDLFAKYLKETESKHGRISEIKFRNKERNGWCAQGSVTHCRAKTFRTRTISPYNSSYYNLYFANSINRMCCYSCKYSSVRRVGDMSIGDYWNIDEILPDIDSRNGISVLLVNSESGLRLFEKLKTNMILYETDLLSAVAGNGNLAKPSDMPASRKDIYKRINEQGYTRVAKEECKYQYVFPFLKKHTPRILKQYLKRVVNSRKPRMSR